MSRERKKKRKRRGRYLQAVFTVEMSVLVPLALFLIMSCILVFFYFHDKNILSAAAYETAVAGSTKAREKGGVDAAELEALFAERIQGKCILFAGAQAGISVSEEEIKVEITAARGGMSLALEHRAAVTEPEKEIRKWRRFIK
ncbi:TadE family protein [Merdimonas faecis]|uniref:Pilus assembly protein n=1 Tax=Merdimonas faecis TaxID=1653435 RepID=A0A9D3AIH8_9FIRM|nr:TadE family protein [Merdimonas faecis]HJH49399.1 pilus assembly protein [Merdimonas faecis]